ncbi:hypothetical protein N7582_000082 [Saccharomyces uvarum]|uniref:Hyphally-regulated cell wall protein N-terminal domain-containing protein n=1 Tax=Saccharomyces uvarum TaxID=230603 RepID=A0AA35JA30_SACUV|nr:hypothetical protein N7582_000082 [Saccharomyces uvarum]CAI4054373.1 hypothetical protein SUVC_01G0870 [Saccharomyces uvarum]
MFNRLNKFQAAVALALYSQSALGQSSFGNSSSTITSFSSASTASASATDSLSSSDGTVYLPSTTISGDLTVTGKVIATEAVEVAAGGKLTLLDGEKYSFTSDLKVDGDLIVAKSEATYEGTAFDVSGATFEVAGNFHAEESAATSASVYSFTPGSFDSTGNISLSLSKAKKGEVTFSPYSNAGAFSFSNAILNGGSVSGLQRRDDDEGSKNNGEINLDNGSTYVIVEPVSGNGTVNIISGNLYLHYPDTFTGQTVNFKGDGVIAVDPTDTNTTPIPVVGYTGKNQIAITQDVSVSYNSETGVLTATKGNVEFSFAIGTGFSSSGFSVSEGLFAEAYAYYLNYDGVIASTGATSSVTATSTTPSSASASGSVTSASVSTSGKFNSTSVSGSAASSAASGSVTYSGASSAASGSVTYSGASSAASGSITHSGLTLETASVYTETLTYANATSTVVVSCSKTTDSNGNIYTVTKTVPCSSTTTATITSCDDNGCHVVPAPTATGVTATTVSSKSYTTATVTHCDDNGCNVKTVTSEASKATSATTIAPKSYTTVTVTHCDDNGCNVKTVTSEAPKATTVSKSGSSTPSTTTSQTHTGIIVQSEGIAAGLRTNALTVLVGAFLLAFF